MRETDALVAGRFEPGCDRMLVECEFQDVQQAIVQLKSPPNAQSTIDKKKSDNPLIDTGQLVSSIRWAYVKPEDA